MKSLQLIKNDLESNGYKWVPNYKNIFELIWAKCETYLNESEIVKSVLWADFIRNKVPMIGLVFITSERIFTLEVVDNNENTQLRYVFVDNYSLDKIDFQPAKTQGSLNYISLVSTKDDNIVFRTPSIKVATHFIETLKGKVNIKVTELEASDSPIYTNSEDEKIIDKDLEKSKNSADFVKKVEVNNEKHSSKDPIKNKDRWSNKKEVEIKKVPPKKEKPIKNIKEQYGSLANSKKWLFWLVLPIIFFTGAVLLIIFI